MKIGSYEFPEGSIIYMGAYKFHVRRGNLMLEKISIAGGVGFVDFEPGIFLMLLQHYPIYSYTLPEGE